MKKLNIEVRAKLEVMYLGLLSELKMNRKDNFKELNDTDFLRELYDIFSDNVCEYDVKAKHYDELILSYEEMAIQHPFYDMDGMQHHVNPKEYYGYDLIEIMNEKFKEGAKYIISWIEGYGDKDGTYKEVSLNHFSESMGYDDEDIEAVEELNAGDSCKIYGALELVSVMRIK